MKKMFAIICLAFALVAGNAAAADWNYVEAAVVSTDVQSVSATGYKLSASKTLGDNFFVQGAYANSGDSDFKAGQASVSFGAKANLLPRSDVYGKVTATALVDDIYGTDKYGYSAEAGIRTQVSKNVELRGGVIATDLRTATLDKFEWLATAGAEVALTEKLRLGVDVQGKSNVLVGQLGLRMYF